jgi:PBSX family phage terminase large subunit
VDCNFNFDFSFFGRNDIGNKILSIYKPNPKQIEAETLLQKGATNNLLFGGSRSGKSFFNIKKVVERAIKFPNSRHLIARNTLKALKNSIILDTMPKVLKICFPSYLSNWNKNYNKSEFYWQLPNGSQIFFCGLGNPDQVEKILGMEFCTIFINECSEIYYRSVLTLRSRLAQKVDNCNLLMLYDCNPPSKSHWTYKEFIELINPLDNRVRYDVKDWLNIIMNPVDNLNNLPTEYIKNLNNLPEQERNRFLFGLWGDEIVGSVFGRYIVQENVGYYEYNPKYPVYTGWDIGYSDRTAIWFFQRIDGNFYFIDYYENHFQPLDHYLQFLDNKPYKYDNQLMYWPHDGANHEWALGFSRRAIAVEKGWTPFILPRMSEQDQISLVRQTLNKCYFDQDRSGLGLNRLKNARYEYIEKYGIFQDSILHDEESDGAKAFIYSIVGASFKDPEKKYLTEEEEQAKQTEINNKAIQELIEEQYKIKIVEN